MAYDQAALRNPGMSGPLGMGARASASAPAHVAYAASGPSHAAAQPSGEPSVSNLFSAADFRRELERVRRARKRTIAIVVIVVLVIVALVAAAVVTGARAHTVNDADMEPVLSQGQAIITVKARELHSGTVVAYHDGNGELQFGRVVAEPGDWVSVSPDGTVAVSDEALSTESAKNVFGSNIGSLTTREVPESSYYVLGDAENATAAGLSDASDFVKDEQVVGKAVVSVWPITSVGPVS